MTLPSLHRLSLREEDPTDAPFDALGRQEIEDLLERMNAANDPNDPCRENLRAFCMSSPSPYLRSACEAFFERLCRNPPFPNVLVPFLCHNGLYNPYQGATRQWRRQWFLFCRVWHAPNQTPQKRTVAINTLRRLDDPLMLVIPAYAFERFNHVDLDTLPSTILIISRMAFYRCRMVTRMQLRNNLTTIETEAFAHCHALQTVFVPDSVDSIGRGAFSYCFALRTIRLPSNNPGFDRLSPSTFRNCTALADLDLPPTLTRIGESSMRGCMALAHLAIPDSVETIENDAFRNCTNLETLQLPVNDEFDTIPALMCYRCLRLQRIVIPDSVEIIRASAFQGCTSLVDVDLGRNVTSVGARAFAGCTALRTLRLPDWNAYPPGRIEGSAIEGCSPNLRVFVGDEEVTQTLQAGVSVNYR